MELILSLTRPSLSLKQEAKNGLGQFQLHGVIFGSTIYSSLICISFAAKFFHLAYTLKRYGCDAELV